MKIFLAFFMAGLCFASQGQVTFYGEPEKIDTLNSASGENYLYLNNKARALYFTREKHSENAGGSSDRGDIWLGENNATWSSPVLLEMNDEHFASPLGYSSDEKYFLYNKVWMNQGIYTGGVFAFSVTDRSEEIKVDIPYFKNRSPIQTGQISSDGRYLLLSLENPMGYGVDDLFMSFLQEDGSWTTPKNLGHQVNTRFQEITPFLAADNRTLFFASNGRDGSGSYDIYVANRLDDTWQRWTKPKNLGDPINTSGAETSFVFHEGGNYAYFVSTQNSDGYGDIRRIRITEEIQVDTTKHFAVRINLSDSLNIKNKQKEVLISFKDANSGNPIRVTVYQVKNPEVGKASREVVSDSTRNFVGKIAPGERWELEFKAGGYLSEELIIGWEELDADSIQVELEPLESGNTITLKNVLFYRGTANFIEGSQRELELVVEMMQENPDVDIFLKGHTDNVGNPVLNVQLSQERVSAVKNYLVEAGVEDSRVSGKGYGGSDPKASNETEETRKLNRRVEFEIIRD